MATSSDAPEGTYQRTCRDIQFVGPDADGRYIITAECRTVSGQWKETELKYDIANCDGNLTWAPDGC